MDIEIKTKKKILIIDNRSNIAIMSDNIFVKYSENNPNFYDGYWRSNPRRNAKCSSMLYGDSYRNHFQKPVNFNLSNQNMCVVEGFANPIPSPTPSHQIVDANKIRKMHSLVNQNPPQLALQENDSYLDNYGYLETDNLEKIKCDGKQAELKFFQGVTKKYDIDLPSLMKKKVVGDIQEIDKIHNSEIKMRVQYGDMKLQHLRNTMQKLHYQLNPKMLEVHDRTFQREKFFQDN